MNEARQRGAESGRGSSQRDREADHAPGRIEDLIARCATGDRAAFKALYDATSGKLFAVCLRVSKTHAAAEDAMQEVYIRIWKNAGRYGVTGQPPMTWLITIARNTAVDHLRARRGQGGVADDGAEPVAAAAMPEKPARTQDGAGAGRIAHCLGALPEDRGAAIRGAYLDGRSYADLADRAGVSPNTMRIWLRDGLIALRKCMGR